MAIELSASGANLLPSAPPTGPDMHCPEIPGAGMNFWRSSCLERQKRGCRCPQGVKKTPRKRKKERPPKQKCSCGRPVSKLWKRSALGRPACKDCIKKARQARVRLRYHESREHVQQVCACGKPVSPWWKTSTLGRPACKDCIKKARDQRAVGRRKLRRLLERREALKASLAEVERQIEELSNG